MPAVRSLEQTLRTRVGECTGRRRGIGQRRGPAFFRQQVDAEGRVAIGREPAREVVEVRGEPAVLVDHEHRALRVGGRGVRGLQLASRARERDRLGRE